MIVRTCWSISYIFSTGREGGRGRELCSILCCRVVGDSCNEFMLNLALWSKLDCTFSYNCHSDSTITRREWNPAFIKRLLYVCNLCGSLALCPTPILLTKVRIILLLQTPRQFSLYVKNAVDTANFSMCESVLCDVELFSIGIQQWKKMYVSSMDILASKNKFI